MVKFRIVLPHLRNGIIKIYGALRRFGNGIIKIYGALIHPYNGIVHTTLILLFLSVSQYIVL